MRGASFTQAALNGCLRALVLLVARAFCYIEVYMLGIGFGEMLAIAVLILVAVGPDRLPAMIKQVAKFYRQFRRTAEDLRASTGIDDLLRDEELRELADFRKHKLAMLAKPTPKPVAEGIPLTAAPIPLTAAPTPIQPGVEPAAAPGVNAQTLKTNEVDPGHAMLGATLTAAARGRALSPMKGLSEKERDLEMPSVGVDVVEARLRDAPMSEEEMQARRARLEAKLGSQPLDMLSAVKAKAGVLE